MAAHETAKNARRRAVVEIVKVDPRAVFERDDWRCYLCGFRGPKDKTPSTDKWGLTLDHIVPVSKGGAHVESNLRTAHRRCNSRKGARAVPALAYHHDVLNDWLMGVAS